jgi:hypothetical protein
MPRARIRQSPLEKLMPVAPASKLSVERLGARDNPAGGLLDTTFGAGGMARFNVDPNLSISFGSRLAARAGPGRGRQHHPRYPPGHLLEWEGAGCGAAVHRQLSVTRQGVHVGSAETDPL